MRVAICYYSGSGNTELACERIAARLDAEVDLVDVVRETRDLSAYDAVGFACSTDFWSMPQLFAEYLAALPNHSGKPAFVFNTCGLRSGLTLVHLAEAVSARGFVVVGAHTMRMAESYPPMMALGLGFKDRPNAADVRKLDAFADRLAAALAVPPVPVRIRTRWYDGLGVTPARTTARTDMGEKRVDAERCTECGTCARSCPYAAIVLDPKPVFDESRCYGCWRCYNRCPERAISTRRFHGRPFYAGPSAQAKESLRAARAGDDRELTL